MWARIVDGVVFEVISYDPQGRYHPGIVWVMVPVGTKPGDPAPAGHG